MNRPINYEDLQAIITALIAEGKCACHIINPHETRILMWKAKDGTYHLRIGIQKFTSQEQTDRNGETYWRYFEFKEPTNLNSNQIAKEYESPNSTEQPTNSPTV